jgi:RecA/RadA recombinase
MAALTHAGLASATDVLSLNPTDILEILGLTGMEAEALLATVASSTSPPVSSAAELVRSAQKEQATALFTGLPSLDACLHGKGLPKGAIVELVGPSGAGKSQVSPRTLRQARQQ